MKLGTLVMVGLVGIGALVVRRVRGTEAEAAPVEEPPAPVRNGRALVELGRAVRAAPALPRVHVVTAEETREFIDEIEVIGSYDGEYGSATIHGDVTVGDEAREGVVVIARSPGVVEQKTTITDEHGRYRIEGVPPGEVVVTFYDQERAAEHLLEVEAGTSHLRHVWEPAPPGLTITHDYIRTVHVPLHAFGDDYTRNIPTGRTFGGVLGVADHGDDITTNPDGSVTFHNIPGVVVQHDDEVDENGDLYGVHISGSTSLEIPYHVDEQSNVYVVDGIDTTGLHFGD